MGNIFYHIWLSYMDNEVIAQKLEERGVYHIQAHLSFTRHKSHEIVCNSRLFLLVDLTLKLVLIPPN